jgi:hypothetical protein
MIKNIILYCPDAVSVIWEEKVLSPALGVKLSAIFTPCHNEIHIFIKFIHSLHSESLKTCHHEKEGYSRQ